MLCSRNVARRGTRRATVSRDGITYWSECYRGELNTGEDELLFDTAAPAQGLAMGLMCWMFFGIYGIAIEPPALLYLH